jgi:hypothetical protein
MFYQDTTDNMVLMIHLNPVTDRDNSVKRGLFATDTNLLSKLKIKHSRKYCYYGGRRRRSGKIFWGSETMGEIIGTVVQRKKRSQRLQAILRTIISCQIIKSGGPCMVQLL